MRRASTVWRRLDLRSRIGLGLLIPVIVAALLAPLLTTIGPDVQRDVAKTRFLAPFTSDIHQVFHPLGTDRLGRDVWARLVHGARVSLLVGVMAMTVSLLIGVIVGSAAAAGSRLARSVLLGVTDFGLGIPRVVLLRSEEHTSELQSL